jgi:hypothetical protein
MNSSNSPFSWEEDIADLRLVGSDSNILWEAPWQTIDPQTFCADSDTAAKHSALYGEATVGKFLSGYTGHALALGYFGMPSSDEAARGLPLHGEAGSAEWIVVAEEEGENVSSLTMEVALPVYGLHFRRTITLAADAFAAAIDETVVNRTGAEIAFQWVQHATFGEPFCTNADSCVFAPVSRARTWPLGYEGHELLTSDAEFSWPMATTVTGEEVDLRIPFQKAGAGFVASLLTQPDRERAYIAVHSRRVSTVAGYSYDRSRFPWIALWEENCARSDPPWNGSTKARGVEFGTSPIPLGLEEARKTETLYDTPVFATVPARSQLKTAYEIFVGEVPRSWDGITDVVVSGDSLVVRNQGVEVGLKMSRKSGA